MLVANEIKGIWILELLKWQQKARKDNMKYKITRKMENLVLEILVIKQLLDNEKFSQREEKEKQLNDLIDELLLEFNKNNK